MCIFRGGYSASHIPEGEMRRVTYDILEKQILDTPPVNEPGRGKWRPGVIAKVVNGHNRNFMLQAWDGPDGSRVWVRVAHAIVYSSPKCPLP